MFTESEKDAVLGLLSLKQVKHNNPINGKPNISGSTNTDCENENTYNVRSNQQIYTSSISQRVQRNQTGK